MNSRVFLADTSRRRESDDRFFSSSVPYASSDPSVYLGVTAAGRLWYFFKTVNQKVMDAMLGFAAGA
jgi:hypothetical protein